MLLWFPEIEVCVFLLDFEAPTSVFLTDCEAPKSVFLMDFEAPKSRNFKVKKLWSDLVVQTFRLAVSVQFFELFHMGVVSGVHIFKESKNWAARSIRFPQERSKLLAARSIRFQQLQTVFMKRLNDNFQISVFRAENYTK